MLILKQAAGKKRKHFRHRPFNLLKWNWDWKMALGRRRRREIDFISFVFHWCLAESTSTGTSLNTLTAFSTWKGTVESLEPNSNHA